MEKSYLLGIGSRNEDASYALFCIKIARMWLKVFRITVF
jgi:hypothetical protein